MRIAAVLTIALGCLAWFGAVSGLERFLGAVLPGVALVVFIIGVVWRIIRWAASPAPYPIPVTGGQARSLDWIRPARFDNPYSKSATVARILFEIVTFRALFRNIRTVVRSEGTAGRAIHYSAKWLWIAALLFHYALLVTLIRHLRFFLEPVPWCLNALETLDGLMQIGAPRLYVSGVILFGATLFLLFRRLAMSRIRYISLPNDYFPLCLLLATAGSGIWMRYFSKVDIASVKAWIMTLAQGSFPQTTLPIGPWFFVHVFFVSLLLICIPFSKLMHFSGIFFSSTLNIPNNSRAVRHVNPWKAPTVYRTYAEYEDEFRERMEEAEIPVDIPSQAAEAAE